MNRKLIISIGGAIILLCLFLAVAPIPVYAAPHPVPIYTYKYVTAPHNLTSPASVSIGCYNSGITTAIMTASYRSGLGVSDLGTFSVQPYAFRGVSPALSEGAYAVEIATNSSYLACKTTFDSDTSDSIIEFVYLPNDFVTFTYEGKGNWVRQF